MLPNKRMHTERILTLSVMITTLLPSGDAQAVIRLQSWDNIEMK
jgi:hypothetical protein